MSVTASPQAPSTAAPAAASSAPKPDMASVILALTPLVVPLMRQALQTSPEGRPGWRTTEFWAVALGSGSSIVAAFGGWIPPHIAVVLTAALGALYLLLRVWQKVRTTEAVALTIDPQAIAAAALRELEARSRVAPALQGSLSVDAIDLAPALKRALEELATVEKKPDAPLPCELGASPQTPPDELGLAGASLVEKTKQDSKRVGFAAEPTED